MRFEVKEISDVKRQIWVAVAPEDLSSIEENVIRDIKRNASVPGFRKGRVPNSLIKKSYADLIKKEVLENALSQFYMEAMREADINPISEGKITNLKFESIAQGLEFEIEVDVEPSIELKKYRGLKVEKEIPVVREEMVEEALKDFQNRHATVKSADTVAEGNIVRLSMQQLGDGDVPIIGRKYEDLEIEVGSGEFDEELEKQLIGLEPHKEAIIRRTPPLTENAESDSGEVDSYKVLIDSIEERELPPLDDELAKNLDDEAIETLDDLKEKIRQELQEHLNRRSVQQVNSRLIDELLKENLFEVPESMVNNYLNHIIQDMRRSDPKQEIDEEQIRQRYRVEAIYLIRWHLLKKRIAEVENIEVREDEVLQRIELAPYSEEEKKYLKRNNDFISRLQDDMLEEKVVKFLNLNAEISEILSPLGESETSQPAKSEK